MSEHITIDYEVFRDLVIKLNGLEEIIEMFCLDAEDVNAMVQRAYLTGVQDVLDLRAKK